MQERGLGVVMVFIAALMWYVAACGGSRSGVPVPPDVTPQIIDDDDYSDPPQLPSTPTPSVATPTASPTPTPMPSLESPSVLPPNVIGIVDTAVQLPPNPPPLRVLFYHSSQLNTEGFPMDPGNYSSEVSLNPPFAFPVQVELALKEGESFKGLAWLDLNTDRLQNAGDLMGYSVLFAPRDTPLEVQMVLQDYPGYPRVP